ncbi:MAG: putative Zn-dependent protease [Cyclobacteriaceae bacterium]|jgi:predicted Zn-dependent protease
MNRSVIKVSIIGAVMVLFLGLESCKKNDGPCSDLGKVGGLLINTAFPISSDVTLGAQVSDNIDSVFAATIWIESEHQAAYDYLNEIKNQILLSEDVEIKDLFLWKLTIINEDVLNAFATPGGYIYVYAGLIKYLDNVDDLAGVMGHEIAHADRRHSVNQQIQNAKLQLLLSVVAGDQSAVAEVAAAFISNVSSLKFSRDDESEADAASVEYLDETQFACNGAAEFFRKLEEEGGSGVPEFLSTHPNPSNRVTDIDARASCRGCSTDNSTAKLNGLTYAQFKALFSN